MELVNPCQIITPTEVNLRYSSNNDVQFYEKTQNPLFLLKKLGVNSLWDTGHWPFDFREKHPAKTAREPMFKFGALKVYGNVRSFFVLANIFLRWICGL